MLKIATLNVNGIRSALRKGLDEWTRARDPDILCLQEIRARPEDLGDWASKPAGMHAYWLPAKKPGYSGVALLCKRKPDKVETKFRSPLFDDEGRWLRADFGNLTVVSLYLPSGTSGDERQQIKYACMDKLYNRLRTLKRSGRDCIIAGDINIAHTQKDIKNWKANQKNSGFLPEERQWLSDVFDKLGWVDVFRRLDERDERYTWWSQRGGARQRNVGWRIDYQIATPKIAAQAQHADIDASPVLSDHAPVVINYFVPD